METESLHDSDDDARLTVVVGAVVALAAVVVIDVAREKEVVVHARHGGAGGVVLAQNVGAQRDGVACCQVVDASRDEKRDGVHEPIELRGREEKERRENR